MNSRYILLILAVLVIISAYMMFTPQTHYETLQIAGSTSVQPVLEKLTDKFQETHPNVRVNVQGGGSGLGIRTVEQGIVNIGMASEELEPEDKAQLNEYVIGKDGIVIAVNNANPVTNLTKDQLKNIFSGNITNWKQLGGPDEEIHVIVRESGSGTLQSFQNIVMGQNRIIKNAIVQSSTESVKQAVKQDPGAIGFISLVNLDSNVKAVSIDGTYPSADTISNGSYELQRPFTLLVKGQPEGVTKEFIDWVMSPEGQSIIKSTKVVPVNNTV